MFWNNHKNEKDRIGSLPIYRFPPPTPAKKEFNAMFELLKDAEKYDRNEDYDVSDMALKNLSDYIIKYIENGKV